MRQGILAGICAFFVAASCAYADMGVAAGAGYKRPINAVIAAFEQHGGNHVDAVYGNMQQIISQTKNSGKIAIMFGEKEYLETKANMPFASVLPVGEGSLVLIYAKGVHIEKPDDITQVFVKKIGIPDPGKAIYGKAGTEFLHKSGLFAKVSPKLITVATVPQVSSYVVAKEFDVGFINITDALGIQKEIGGYIMIDKKLYNPIHIAAFVVKGHENDADVKAFIAFLKTPQAKKILKEYGL